MYFTDKRKISLSNFFKFFLMIDFHKENGVSPAESSVPSCTQISQYCFKMTFLLNNYIHRFVFVKFSS